MCGLDPKRPVLDGTEMRACWTAMPRAAEPDERRMAAVGPGRKHAADHHATAGTGRQPRTFVLVEPEAAAMTREDASSPVGTTTDAAVTQAAAISPATGTGGRIPGTWWLWGDPEPWPDY
jgi:hypothetical protein